MANYINVFQSIYTKYHRKKAIGMVIFKYFFEQKNQLYPSAHAYHKDTEGPP
jgi:hypothetical protein